MTVTPVSISRLPQAAGFVPLTEIQAGVAAQSRPSGRRGKLDVGEILLRVGRGQSDVHPSPGNDIAAPHARLIGAVVIQMGDVQERILVRPALGLMIMPAAESYPHHRNPVRR